MNLFNKKSLIIHESRLNGEYTRTDSDKTLIEHIFKGGVQKFPHLVFKGNPSQCSKETQVNQSDKESFLSHDGEFTIIETPGAVAVPAWVVWATVILSVASTVYAFYVANKYSASDTDSTSSANRSLTQRQNKERPMERIEDIAGQVRSYPTLIQPDYRKFNNSRVEIEYSLMCHGVGEYDIDTNEIKDSDTLVSAIQDSGACFYGPGVMPGNSSNAFLTAGVAFNEEVRAVTKADSVGGGEVFETEKDMRYVIDAGDGEVVRDESAPLSGIYWFTLTSTDETELATDYGDTGDSIYIDNLVLTTGSPGSEVDINFEGNYEIQSIGNYHIVVSAIGGGDVNSVNANWDVLAAGDTYITQAGSFWRALDFVDATYLGDYFLPGNDRDRFWINVIAQSGLRYDSGKSLSVSIDVEYAQADSGGNKTGSWISAGSVTIGGRTSNRIGATHEVTTSFTGPMLMRARRTTGFIGGAVLQDVYLDAMYGSAPIGVTDFGDVTTVQTRTFAKGTAANLSSRSFNALITRKLNTVQSNGTLSPTKTATKRFIDYFAYATTNEFIGRRDASELDYQEEYDQYQDIISYFGSSEAGEFSYTFDENEISYQDTADLICGAVFSIPIRKNGIISTKFERPSAPRTLFNHRNKLPGSQAITRTFINDDYTDGVEFQWVDPSNDDSISTIYIPSDNSATRPELVESAGVRNYAQAYWLAYRRFNKIQNQRISIDETVTSEGQLLSQLDVAAITDDTKADIYSGEIIGVSGLTLYLNQPVVFTEGETHSVSLRKRDGSVEILGCGIGADSMSVILTSTPSEAPYTGTEEERTRFTFSADTSLGADYYLISKIDRNDPNEIKLTGYNYTDDFYKNDTDTPVQ